MSAAATLAPDAAMVLGIASAAMPFARTPHEEAERWLRVLRLHGEVGVTLQALGVSEGPLGTPPEHEPPAVPGGDERDGPGSEVRDAPGGEVDCPPAGEERDAPGEVGDAPAGEERDAVQRVSEHALQIALRRGAAGVATTDLLMAVMRVYGEEFDRVLHAHGTDREEVLARLGAPLD
jgi:hypothetical protein